MWWTVDLLTEKSKECLSRRWQLIPVRRCVVSASSFKLSLSLLLLVVEVVSFKVLAVVTWKRNNRYAPSGIWGSTAKAHGSSHTKQWKPARKVKKKEPMPRTIRRFFEKKTKGESQNSNLPDDIELQVNDSRAIRDYGICTSFLLWFGIRVKGRRMKLMLRKQRTCQISSHEKLVLIA